MRYPSSNAIIDIIIIAMIIMKQILGILLVLPIFYFCFCIQGDGVLTIIFKDTLTMKAGDSLTVRFMKDDDETHDDYSIYGDGNDDDGDDHFNGNYTGCNDDDDDGDGSDGGGDGDGNGNDGDNDGDGGGGDVYDGSGDGDDDDGGGGDGNDGGGGGGDDDYDNYDYAAMVRQ